MREKKNIRRKFAANKSKDSQGKAACRTEMNSIFRMEC